jgi:hypothetical protein|tara:strand:- start:23 stop:145 length:123 start_codon:yes stop_codon:yes gene_type:complete
MANYIDGIIIFVGIGLIAASPDIVGYLVDRVQGLFNEKDK